MSDLVVNPSVPAEAREERIRAHAKHGINSLEAGERVYQTSYRDRESGGGVCQVFTIDPNHGYRGLDRRWVDARQMVPTWDEKQNRILVEEVGEISRAMNEFALNNTNRIEYEIELRKEIIQSIAVLWAWADKLLPTNSLDLGDGEEMEWVVAYSPDASRIGITLDSYQDGLEDEEVVRRAKLNPEDDIDYLGEPDHDE